MNQYQRPRSKFELAHDNFVFDEWPFYNMSRLISIYHRRLDAVLKPIGIDTPRWRVLRILGKRGTATVTQISDEAATMISTTAKIIRRMVAQELVSTSVSQKDARSIEVSLTPHGRQTLDIALRKVDTVAARAFMGIAEDDIDLMNKLTKQMYEQLEH